MDTFADHQYCVDRLLKEYRRHPRLIIAVDFDDTVFPWTFQDSDHSEILQLVRDCQSINFYIVCWTASDPSRYEMIEKYFLGSGIRLDSINKNPIKLPFGNNGKIYYNILLDDRAGLASAASILREVVDIIKREKP